MTITQNLKCVSLGVFFGALIFLQPVLAAIEPDGSLDLPFDAGKITNGEVDATILQPDGKLLISGTFSKVNGVTRHSIARLNPNGTLDFTFDPGDGPDTNIGVSTGTGGMVLQPDGKIIIYGPFSTVSGAPRFGIARLNSDGSLDNGFDPGRVLSQDGVDDGNGGAATPGLVNGVLLQPDGNVVIVGQFFFVMTGGGNSVARSCVARFNSDGTFDPSFDPGAGLNNSADSTLTAGNAIVRQSTGNIIIAGLFDQFDGNSVPGLVRLNPNGSYDSTFNPGSAAPIGSLNLFVLSDDRILAIGNFTSFSGFTRSAIVRLNATTGAVDNGFATGVFKEFADPGLINSVAEQADHKLIVGGFFHSLGGITTNTMARLNTDGSWDNTFDVSVATGLAPGVDSFTIRPGDGKIFVGGYFTSYNNVSRNNIALVNPDGSLDNVFVPAGGVTDGSPTIFASATQSDGKVIIAGVFSLVNGEPHYNLVRLNTDGSIDHTFGVTRGTCRSVRAMLIQPDGKIMIAGVFGKIDDTRRGRVARLNADGTIDLSFDPGDGADSVVYAIAHDNAGNTYVGGDFQNMNGTPRVRLAKLTTNGSVDATFDPGTGFNSAVRAIAPPNGAAGPVIGGSFASYNGTPAGGIARVDATTGAIDMAFTANTGTAFGPNFHNVRALAVTSAGQYLVGGNFNTFNGVFRPRLLRLNSDGSPDPAFVPNPWPTGGAVFTLAQQNGKIVAAGNFTSPFNRIARYLDDGTLDGSFNPGAGVDLSPPNALLQTSSGLAVNTITSDPLGRILVGGLFNQYNGTTRTCFVRLSVSSTFLVDGVNGVASSCEQLQTSLGGGAVNYAVIDGALPPGMTLSSSGLLCGTPTALGSYFFVVQATDAYSNSVTQAFTKTIVAPFTLPPLAQRPAILDSNFHAPFFTAPEVASRVLLKPDGKFVLLTFPDSLVDQPTGGITQYLSDGTLDTSFHFSEDYASVFAAAVLPDGRLIVAAQRVVYGAAVNDTLHSNYQILRLNLDGSIDPTFNQNAQTNSGGVRVISIQSDGKILVGGTFSAFAGVPRNGIVRLLSDGTLDPNFAALTMGNAHAQGGPDQVAGLWANPVVQSGGKIIIAGDFDSVNGVPCPGVARLNANGTLDSGFNATGFSLRQFGPPTHPDGRFHAVRGVVVQANGQIVIGGRFVVDASFASNPTGQTYYNLPLVRLNPDGSADQSYGYFDFGSLQGLHDGFASVRFLALQPDGKVLAGANSLYRFNTDGSLDPSLRQPLLLVNRLAADDPLQPSDPEIFSVNIQTDGRILVGGTFTDVDDLTGPPNGDRFSVARFNSDGTLDSMTTSHKTALRAAPSGFVRQGDGSTIITFNGADIFTGIPPVSHSLGRLLSSGSVDAGFNPFAEFNPAGALTQNFLALGMAPFTDGKAFVFGTTQLFGDPTYGKLLSDGTEDVNYSGGVADFTNAVAQPDGQVLVTSDDPQHVVDGNVLRRIGANGSFDNSFHVASEVTNAMAPRDMSNQLGMVSIGSRVLACLSDRRILFSYLAADNTYRLVRLNLDGSLDSAFVSVTIAATGTLTKSFQPNSLTPITVSDPPNGDTNITELRAIDAPVVAPTMADAKVLSDGKVVVTGSFTSYNGNPAHGIIRLNSDGTVDPTFHPGGGAQWTQTTETATQHPAIERVEPESDGTMLIVGTFEAYDGNAAPGIGMLKADGSFENSFLPPAFRRKFDTRPTYLAAQSDGSLLLSGPYTRNGDTVAPSFLRLVPAPAVQTTTGTNVSVNAGMVGSANVSLTFPNITSAGVTTVSPINPSTAGTLPSGFELDGATLAFEITTTATFVTPPPIIVAFQVPGVDALTFSQLRVLHNEGGTLVDRTATSPAPNPATQTIYASVSSLSPFVVARRGGCQFSVSSAANFNGTQINKNSYIWFNSVLKPSGLGSKAVTIRFTQQKISSSAFTLSVPDATVTFDPAATSATTTFSGGSWVTRVPSSGLSGNTFLSALGYVLPANLAGGLKNVTWSGVISPDTAGVSVQMQWAAAVYTSFSTDNTALGVKPVDDNKASQYKNSDHAGTPENFKSKVTGGATGGGGSNYTGGYSGTVSTAPCPK